MEMIESDGSYASQLHYRCVRGSGLKASTACFERAAANETHPRCRRTVTLLSGLIFDFPTIKLALICMRLAAETMGCVVQTELRITGFRHFERYRTFSDCQPRFLASDAANRVSVSCINLPRRMASNFTHQSLFVS